MRIIHKTARFGSSDDQEFYHERFSSYKEFIDTVDSRQSNAHKGMDEILSNGGSGWVGVKSVNEARELLLNGWEKNVERLKSTFNRELDSLEHDRPVKLANSVCGFMPIVPNAIMGLPNSMIDVRMSKKKSRILSFMVSIDRSCSTSTEEIIKRMSKVLAYIAMLERSGQYRCRIEVYFTAFGGCPRDKVNTSCSILVKSENQLFDIKRTCFPVIHPAMLRLFMFAWEESLPLDYDTYRCYGYGTSFEHWDEEYKKDFIDNVLNENNEKTICIDLMSNMEEIIGKEVR